ncbi:hypothetical protein GCM10019016_074480 [Streptomyces prasinosporus]|uniref:Secreted protein n=1 Tax=Streptomyces prasinosporus TaxID=68256 RepID=A0ABP6TYW5_9ACTN
MARNKVMKLWTVIVTALLALCTALGLVTTTASAAVPQTEPTRNGESLPSTSASGPVPLLRALLTALPPTMKQRIRAEAHGKSPSCRHRPPADTPAAEDPATEDPAVGEPTATAPATTAPAATDPSTTDCSEATTSPAESRPGDAPLRR